jgi:entericidin B
MSQFIYRVAFFALLLAPIGLSACNTVKGVGKDIENTGDAIEDAADDAQEELND